MWNEKFRMYLAIVFMTEAANLNGFIIKHLRTLQPAATYKDKYKQISYSLMCPPSSIQLYHFQPVQWTVSPVKNIM